MCASIAIKGARERTEQSLTQAFIALDESNTLEMVQKQLEVGQELFEIIEQRHLGIAEVREHFGRGKYYLSELIMLGDIFEQCMALMEPYPEVDRAGPSLWTGVIGTVKGDIHDPGKNIVIALFRCDGFEVINLGLEPPRQGFMQGGKQSSEQREGCSTRLPGA